MHAPQTEVILRHDGVELARATLPPGEYVIGRSREVDIHAETPLLSRKHARLTINFDELFIEDLGSSNGTYVAEEAIAATTRVFPNQSVRLGDVTLETHRERATPEPEMSLAPRLKVIQRHLPEELLTAKRHIIGRTVARGGMGEILDACQTATKRNVAMKVMLDAGDQADVLRFIEEAQVTAQLEHPNIVPVHELGLDEHDHLYYTMKMVRGITLKKVLDLLAQGVEATLRKYPLAALLTIFQKVCDGIAFAHARGVIHRDLKPENIMLGDFGEVLIMDWGLAKVIHPLGSGVWPAPGRARAALVASARNGEFGCTMAGTIMGTPYYMAPEQAAGEIDRLDQRTDIYALGAILFHLLFLRYTVTGKTLEEVVDNVRAGRIQWPDPHVALRDKAHSHLPNGRPPESLVAVCRKALALDPAQRYARVEALQADLEAYQHGFATSAEKVTPLRHVGLLLGRHQFEALAATLVLALGLGLGTKAVVEGRRARFALAHLERTAPALMQLADQEASFQRFDSALDKLDAALRLDPALHAAHWRRAWIFLGLEKWSEAADALRLAERKNPAHRSLAAILPTVEQLAAAPPPAGKTATPPEVAVMRYLESVGAGGSVARLVTRFGADAGPRQRLVQQRLEETLGKGRFKTEISPTVKWVVVRDVDKTLASLDAFRGLPIDVLDLNGARITSLEPLRGVALHELNLSGTAIADLEPLRGMPLHRINLNGTKVADLAPLTGAPLKIFTAEGCLAVRDLTPLRGAPLREVRVSGTGIVEVEALRGAPLELFYASGTKLNSLAPLRGAPLREVGLGGTAVRDLSPLAGRPLTRLSADNCPVIDLAPLRDLPLEFLSLRDFRGSDLAPLRGLPLKELILTNPKQALSYEPLLELPQLERIACTRHPALFPALRRHRTLRYIDCWLVPNENAGLRPVAEFWAASDALAKSGAR